MEVETSCAPGFVTARPWTDPKGRNRLKVVYTPSGAEPVSINLGENDALILQMMLTKWLTGQFFQVKDEV